MRVNVRQLETGNRGEERSLSFAYDLDLSHVRSWGHTPYRAPARVSGTVTSRLGILTLDYTVEAVREDNCARCLRPVKTARSLEFSHIIMERDQKNEIPDGGDDAYILLEDGELDLDELAVTDLLLEEEQAILCKPDCKGICPTCGADLNETSCSCSVNAAPGTDKEPDARFAALLKLINNENN